MTPAIIAARRFSLFLYPGPPGNQFAALRVYVRRASWRLSMSLDIERLKHEVEQLGALDVARQAAEVVKSDAEAALTVATAELESATTAASAASGNVTAQIAFITGLLGVTSPVPDPTPDPEPEPVV